MTYEEAKKQQIECFRERVYLVLREWHDCPGQFYLMPAASKQVAQESIVKDVIAAVKRLPTRLRALPGGKS